MKKKNLKERLLSKVKVRKNGCWEWQGSISEKGYGRVGYEGKNNRAHRVSWIAFKGVIKKGFCVCHHCDNKRCINPDHLFQGTNQDNVTDKMIKGRYIIPSRPNGENHPLAKLKNKDVLYIRESNERAMDLAKKFKMHIGSIYSIKNKETWKHI